MTRVKRTVGELGLKEVVISPRDLGDCLGQVLSFLIVEVDKSSLVLLAQNHDLKGPGCPPWTYGKEGGILKDNALLLLSFQLGIVFQQVLSTMLSPILF